MGSRATAPVPEAFSFSLVAKRTASTLDLLVLEAPAPMIPRLRNAVSLGTAEPRNPLSRPQTNLKRFRISAHRFYQLNT
eukprot:1835274-Prymnesium_polylepis.1